MAKQPFRIDGGLKAGSVGIQELDSAAQLQAIPVGLDSVAVTGSIFTLAEVDVANGAAMSAYQVLRWNSNTSKFTADDDSDTFLTGITDASNTALGVSALATGGGTDNVAIGHSALTLSTGSGNIALGDDAGSALVSGDNNVIIGRNDGSSIEGKDGQLIVANGAGSLVMSADSAQKVSFAGDLDVAGVLTFGSTTETTDKISEGSSNYYWTEDRFSTSFALKTTDSLVEGSTNQYYTVARFNSEFANRTTDSLTEGSSNYYYTEDRFNTSFAGKTTDSLTEGPDNQYYTVARFNSEFANRTTDSLSEGSSNYYWTEDRFNTSFAGKNTDSLTEGSDNYFWTETRFNTSFGLKTTDSLAEGSNNLYYTVDRFNEQFANRTTDSLTEGSDLYYTVARFNSEFANRTTDSLTEGSSNYYWTDGRFNTSFGLKTTDSLAEGPNNLYFTTARAAAAIRNAYVGGTGVTYDPNTYTVSIGQPVETTSDVKFGSAVIDQRKAIETAEVTTSATAQATIDTFPIADFRSGTYTITVTEGTNYQSTEMLVTHDDTSAYMVEFGTLTTGSDLADFDVAINGADLEVKATPASANSTEFKIVRHLVGENITTGQGSGSGSGGSGSGGSGSGGSGGGSSSSYSLGATLEEDQFLFLDPTDTTNATSSSWTNTTTSTAVTSAMSFDVSNTTFETSGSTNIGYVMDATSEIVISTYGTDNSLAVADNNFGSNFNGKPGFSLAFWVKTTETGAGNATYRYNPYCGLTGSPTNDVYAAMGIDDGKFTFASHNDGTGWESAVSSTSVNDGDWHHVMLVWETDGSGKLYVDGVADTTFTGLTISGSYYFRIFFIGKTYQNGSGGFIGSIGAVRGFDRAVTDSEVETVFDVEAQQYGLTPIN